MIGTETTDQIDGMDVASVTLSHDGNDRNHSEQIPTIFLHGWGGSAQSFQQLWESLEMLKAPFSTLTAIDLPGFGKTLPPPTPWSITDYCSCVVKYMDRHGIKKADIVSHSFGGRLTTKLLSMHPERFRNVVYIAPAGIYHHSARVSTIQRVASIAKPVLQLPGLRKFFPAIQSFGYRLIGSQDYTKTSGVMRETFKNVIAEDTAPLLGTIKNPIEIFWGRNDGYVPVSDSELMKRAMPQAHVTIFEDGRHGIHVTHAQQIAIPLAKFLYS